MKATKRFSYSTWVDTFDRIDQKITQWMARSGLFILRMGLGIVFLWFGTLKLVPDLSPDEELVRQTTYFVDPDWFVPVLAIWEMSIGLGFLIGGKLLRLTLLLLFLQMPRAHLEIREMSGPYWIELEVTQRPMHPNRSQAKCRTKHQVIQVM